MSGTRTTWSAGLAAVVVCVAVLEWLSFFGSGKGRPERGEPPNAERPRGAPSSAPEVEPVAIAAPLPSAIAQTLRSVHEQRLVITPPVTPAQRLAFGPGRLAQASEGRVFFRDTKQGELIADVDLGVVRAVAHGSDGALFALGASGGTRLDSRATKSKDFPRVTFLPGSALFGDLEDPSHFYVFYAEEPQLFRYPFEVEGGALLPIDAQFPFEGCTGALALLRDGAFVCRTASGLARRAPRGRRVEYRSPAQRSEPFRLLPAKRLDELFAISGAGEVLHLRLAPGLPVLGRFQLPWPAYAVDANAEALAFVLVSPPEPGQPRRWALLVTDFEGQRRFRVELSAKSVAADEAWLATVVEDKNLAISDFEPLVAVGGGSQLTVWNYAQGSQLFAR